MNESPNGMVLSGPSDPPIIDSFGNAWRITTWRQVSANGVVENTLPVAEIAYVNRRMWLLTSDDLWRCKVHPTDLWVPADGIRQSPISSVPVDPTVDDMSHQIATLQVTANLILAGVVKLGPDPRIDSILGALESLTERITSMSGTLDSEITQLQADVTAQTTIIASAEAMISGISAQVSAAVAAALAAGASPDELQELTQLDASLQANSTSLAAAVAANTPAPATPTPTPAPTPSP